MSIFGKHTLTTQVMVAMVAGAVTGILLSPFHAESAFVRDIVTGGLFHVIGGIFIAALKMLVVPLVLASLVVGVTGLSDLTSLGRIGVRALVLYLFTTAVALTIALFVAGLVSPGEGFKVQDADISFTGTEPPDLRQVLIDMVPSNPFAAMADGAMLQVIVFALLLGVAITLTGAPGKPVLELFRNVNAVVMRMVEIVMAVAPVGVFCLVAKTFSAQGLDVILPLAAYFLTVLASLLLHAFCSYSVILVLLARVSPRIFFTKMRAAMTFAFSTASSSATMPITLRSVEHRLGVDNSVASFTIPLGATINMDGTAIMQGVATVFIAAVYGIDLSTGDYLMVVLTGTLASVGTAGVPGVGLIMLSMVLVQVGLPVEGIALIIGVDRLLDMVRTAVNITGDAAITMVIARAENALDEKRFRDPRAGTIVGGV
ncbi:MAG: dicarboxylate/amino acid:cation symporter [Gammaproteobacteria bacterium]|nr:dicarboxylate/amino acid:cation symporter [Gammaproteobacteria bacterium]MDJ0873452.1 dicarboxylate/amino acid:cation symporter [Gammaproteobacteria bacterium]